ncbi:acylphosphatase [Sphingomonas sp.]|uniref:acylphosphatase n=1 Tax=Sphingomonas sp. TaxID=28214 RepID=UPI003B000E73
MTIARRLLISGRVQGVSYRDWTIGAARALGLAGWVRNLADGRVEAWIEGEALAIEAMVERCREGPEHARVDAVEVHEAPPEGASDFMRR